MFFTGVETAPGFAILSSSLLRRLKPEGGKKNKHIHTNHIYELQQKLLARASAIKVVFLAQKA